MTKKITLLLLTLFFLCQLVATRAVAVPTPGTFSPSPSSLAAFPKSDFPKTSSAIPASQFQKTLLPHTTPDLLTRPSNPFPERSVGIDPK